MLNGAVTLGTMDGANVEIAQMVGEENIYTFGESSDSVIQHYRYGDYSPKEWFKRDRRIAAALDFLIGPEMLKAGDAESLHRLYDELVNKDWFMTLPDFEDYCRIKGHALYDTLSKDAWAEKMLVNIANAGYFSSDRTIEQYNKDIWHIL